MTDVQTDDIKFQKLKRFNLIMGFFHFIQAVVMLAIANYDVQMSFTTSYLDTFPPIAPGAVETLFTVPLGPMVAIFLMMSAIAHLSLATFGFDWYVKNLKMNMNKARWLEYAISSSFMLIVIAWLCGMFDFVSIMLLFSLNACMNLFGYMMEVHNQKTEKTDWTSFLFGCFAGLVPWIALFMYFTGAAGSPPGFVYGIMISIAFFFNIFAINMVLQYKKVGKWKDYLYGEWFYIVLSLVAKSALAWQVFAGTMVG